MRPENWPDLLASYVRDSADLTFEWGTRDCALWVCGWLLALTGTDHAAAFRGTYDSEEGANEALLARGYDSLEALADACLPAKSIHFAQRGDIVLSPTGALGICTGTKSHFLSLGGLIALPTFGCTKAWGA